MRIGRSIFQGCAIAFHVSVCHLCKALRQQPQFPHCARPSVMKTFNEMHDYLLSNITIAIAALPAIEAVFIRRFLSTRQADSNHQMSGLLHSVFPILWIVGREVAHQGKPADNSLLQPQASVHSLQ
jgi:hypothetical protein